MLANVTDVRGVDVSGPGAVERTVILLAGAELGKGRLESVHATRPRNVAAERSERSRETLDW